MIDDLAFQYKTGHAGLSSISCRARPENLRLKTGRARPESGRAMNFWPVQGSNWHYVGSHTSADCECNRFSNNVICVEWKQSAVSVSCEIQCSAIHIIIIIIIITAICIAQNRLRATNALSSTQSDSQTKSNVFSCVLNVVTAQSDDLTAAGRLFHIDGLETAKLLSP